MLSIPTFLTTFPHKMLDGPTCYPYPHFSLHSLTKCWTDPHVIHTHIFHYIPSLTYEWTPLVSFFFFLCIPEGTEERPQGRGSRGGLPATWSPHDGAPRATAAELTPPRPAAEVAPLQGEDRGVVLAVGRQRRPSRPPARPRCWWWRARARTRGR
jgi:hypothetical protein